MSHYLPVTLGMHTEWLEPWAREIEKRTNNRVKITTHVAGSALGNLVRQWDQAKDGTVDISFGLHGQPRGRFGCTTVMEIPMLYDSAEAGNRILMALYPKYLSEEHAGVKVLGLFTHAPGMFSTRERQLRNPEDLKGQRIRVPSPAVGVLLQDLGAIPVGLPPGQIYESLMQGSIDGIAFTWTGTREFKLLEVTKHHLDARFYATTFFFVMNQKRYDSLPADIRKVFDDMSGDAFVARSIPLWDKWDEPGPEAARQRGNTIVTLTSAEREQWRDKLRPTVNKLVAQMEKECKNGREVFEEAQRLGRQLARK
jgi:TRAP-type C4-dicarboxylate transport system substrate-binding protein